MRRAAAALAAMLPAMVASVCVKTPDGFNCPLCPGAAENLIGDGTVWYVGGVPGGEPCPAYANTPEAMTVMANAIVQPGASSHIAGGLVIVGGGVRVSDVSVGGRIRLTAPTLLDVRITNVNVSDCHAGVRVYDPDPLSPVINVSGLVVDNVRWAPGDCDTKPPRWAAVATAHVANAPMSVTCASPDDIVVVQPRVRISMLTTLNCHHVVDLSALINVYGKRYEVLFEHWEYVPEAGGYAFWLWRLAVFDAVVGVAIAMCVYNKNPNNEGDEANETSAQESASPLQQQGAFDAGLGLRQRKGYAVRM
jgi:hypothetical protein